jgi:hypothetical protein
MVKNDVLDESKALQNAFSDPFLSETLEYLEFLSNGPRCFEAFQVPDEGMSRAGRRGKAIDKFYLFNRWFRGKDAGIFKRVCETGFSRCLEHNSKIAHQSIQQMEGGNAEEKIGSRA